MSKRPRKIRPGVMERMDEASATLIWLRSELAAFRDRGEGVPLARLLVLVTIVDETLRLLGKFDMSTDQATPVDP